MFRPCTISISRVNMSTSKICSMVRMPYVRTVAYSGILFRDGGGVQQIQLRTEDRANGDLGAVAP